MSHSLGNIKLHCRGVITWGGRGRRSVCFGENRAGKGQEPREGSSPRLPPRPRAGVTCLWGVPTPAPTAHAASSGVSGLVAPLVPQPQRCCPGVVRGGRGQDAGVMVEDAAEVAVGCDRPVPRSLPEGRKKCGDFPSSPAPAPSCSVLSRTTLYGLGAPLVSSLGAETTELRTSRGCPCLPTWPWPQRDPWEHPAAPGG